MEAHFIRRALEGEAARHFVSQATDEDKKKLTVLSDLFDKFAVSDPLECEEADLQFHLHIVRSAKLQRLFELIENSKIETTVIFGLAMNRDPREVNYAKLVGIHNPVVKALLGKDPDRAMHAVWHHVDSILERIIKLEQLAEKPEILAEGSTGSSRR